MSKPLEIGDIVTYSSRFLKATGLMFQVGRAEVIGFDDFGERRLVLLKQLPRRPGVSPLPDKVLEPNLIRVADLHKEPV
jgi:hypothetical protein